MENLSNKEFGYIVGLFIGDGYSDYNKKDRHYRIDFCLNSNRDKDIIKYLSYLFRKAKLNPFIVKDKRYSALSVRLNSKFLFNLLRNEQQKFENKKFDNRAYMYGLLSGLIDSEGYVANGEITITQKDKSVLNTVRYICEKLNVNWTKMWSYNFQDHKIWRFRISTSFKNKPHISCKVLRQYSR